MKTVKIKVDFQELIQNLDAKELYNMIEACVDKLENEGESIDDLAPIFQHHDSFVDELIDKGFTNISERMSSYLGEGELTDFVKMLIEDLSIDEDIIFKFIVDRQKRKYQPSLKMEDIADSLYDSGSIDLNTYYQVKDKLSSIAC